MKKVALAILLMVFSFVGFSQTYTGNLTLSTQAAVNAFDYTKVTGDLKIIETVSKSITNLNHLSKLTSVEGDLYISLNASLTSLTRIIHRIYI